MWGKPAWIRRTCNLGRIWTRGLPTVRWERNPLHHHLYSHLASSSNCASIPVICCKLIPHCSRLRFFIFPGILNVICVFQTCFTQTWKDSSFYCCWRSLLLSSPITRIKRKKTNVFFTLMKDTGWFLLPHSCDKSLIIRLCSGSILTCDASRLASNLEQNLGLQTFTRVMEARKSSAPVFRCRLGVWILFL